MPPSIEERVAYLEGRVGKVDDLGPRIDAVDRKLDRGIEFLSGRIDALDQALSGRIDTLDQALSGRIDALDQKIDRVRVELSTRMDTMDTKFDRMNDRMGVQFRWLVGIQVAVLVVVVGALLSR